MDKLTSFLSLCLCGILLFQTVEYVQARDGRKCPPFGTMAKNCYCMQNSYLFRGPFATCRDVSSVEDLHHSLETLKGNPIEALQLSNLSIPYLPRDGLFQGMNISYLWLSNSNLTSFCSLDSDGPSPFAGLEDSLQDIKLEFLPKLEYLGWQELKSIKKLESLEINTCNLNVIGENFASLPDSFKYLKVFQGSVNGIESGAFSSNNLTRVGLGYSNLTSINRNIFAPNATRLLSIDLMANKLKEIPDNFFQGMPALTFAAISWNRLETLPLSLKTIWNQLESVYVAYNPFRCDCDLLWLLRASKAEKQPYNDLEFVKCASPLQLRNRTLISLQESDLCP